MALAGLSSAAFRVSAQTIDPTVEVSRDYVGKLIEVHKPVQTMPLPDSLQHFDLGFDYFVNDSPYRGAYVFSPYVLDMAPGKTDFGERRLWLKAGAGFALQPVLDFVWSPVSKGNFRMNVYGTHRSYFGRYRGIRLSPMSQDGLELTADDYAWKRYSGPEKASGSTSYRGYESHTRAGVDGILAWKGGSFGFDLSYCGTAAEDTSITRGYDAFDARLSVRSDNDASRKFLYDVSVRYRFGEDKAQLYGPGAGSGYFQGHEFSLDASLGPRFSPCSGLSFGIGLDMSGYPSWNAAAGDFSFVPQYRLDKGRWDLDLGVKFAMHFSSPGTMSGMLATRGGQFVYPAVSVAFEAVRNYLDLYVKADGGDSMDTWSDLLGRNSRMDIYRSPVPVLGNNVEKVAADFGLRGNIASRFGYDLSTGYVLSGQGFFDGIVLDGTGNPVYVPVYAESRLYHVTMSCRWESEDFSADARLSYRDYDLAGDAYGALAPAAFTGYVNMIYNWKKRIFAGIDCGFSGPRRTLLLHGDPAAAASVEVPGYADLGITVEFKFSRQLSFWAHGGNLLDMTVQRIPLYAESGVNFTAGICLNL